MPQTANNLPNAIQLWIATLCALIIAMILLGGFVRLTHAGLAITNWKPIIGILPPATETQWQESLQLYQKTAHYKEQHQGISLAQFKNLYWREWTHRALGRILGLTFLIPLCFLWITKTIPPKRLRQLTAIFLLVALQGWLGWKMVQSGLAEQPDVSQYRLSAHLGLAFIIYGCLFRLLLIARRPPAPNLSRKRRVFSARAAFLIGLLFLQILLGGLTAGLDAGLIHNSWPLMNGRFFPENALTNKILWRNATENPAAVQFLHRLNAYCLVALLAIHLASLRGDRTLFRSALTLMILLIIQAALGIALLLLVMPIPLALAHQFGGVILWSAALWHHQLCRQDAPAPRAS